MMSRIARATEAQDERDGGERKRTDEVGLVDQYHLDQAQKPTPVILALR